MFFFLLCKDADERVSRFLELFDWRLELGLFCIFFFIDDFFFGVLFLSLDSLSDVMCVFFEDTMIIFLLLTNVDPWSLVWSYLQKGVWS